MASCGDMEQNDVPSPSDPMPYSATSADARLFTLRLERLDGIELPLVLPPEPPGKRGSDDAGADVELHDAVDAVAVGLQHGWRSLSPDTSVQMERTPASMTTSGANPIRAIRCWSWRRRLLLKFALAAIRNITPPVFWAKINIALAVGICGAGTRPWIAMYA